jgi:hypothetical protein
MAAALLAGRMQVQMPLLKRSLSLLLVLVARLPVPVQAGRPAASAWLLLLARNTAQGLLWSKAMPQHQHKLNIRGLLPKRGMGTLRRA